MAQPWPCEKKKKTSVAVPPDYAISNHLSVCVCVCVWVWVCTRPLISFAWRPFIKAQAAPTTATTTTATQKRNRTEKRLSIRRVVQLTELLATTTTTTTTKWSTNGLACVVDAQTAAKAFFTLRFRLRPGGNCNLWFEAHGVQMIYWRAVIRPIQVIFLRGGSLHSSSYAGHLLQRHLYMYI